MFTTQQRVTRSSLSITPRTGGQKIGNSPKHVSGKGKAVAFMDDLTPPPPPPLGLLIENGASAAAEGGDLDDWRAFKEAGLLDEASMERKDREALAEKTARLEKELFDYQYNMGLLLIENKELTENAEQLREALSEIQEVVKREEAAHLMDVSEVERRADNLKKALDLEKLCRADLEKALREIVEENKQIKLRSQTNLADANTLVAGIGDKSREVEEKMYEADAKLAEANRKSLELDRRMQELETHESLLKSERQSFNAGREAWEATFAKQKEDIKEWEKKLQEGEERLCEGRRSINLREEKLNEMEKSLKLKEKEIEEAHNKIESSILASKKKEDDVNKRLDELIAKEEQAESIKKKLEVKEKELLDLTEKLTAKERVEIQKLLDAHKNTLDSKQREFELEMEEKRKSLEDEMRKRIEALVQKEDETNHKEEKLRKQEQAHEKKLERFNEKEKELDTKLRAIKEKEKSYEMEAKKLEMEKNEILADIEKLQILKAETEKIKNQINEKEAQVHEEIEKLRITEDERIEYTRLQLELKEEIEKCRVQKELIMKEVDDLRKDRMKFEKEWEVLDDKRAVVNEELIEFEEQKENWEKVRKSEEEKLEKDKIVTQDYVNKELEALKLERETFAATMKHEETLLVEKAENEQRQFVHDFEKRKRDLEVDLQNQRIELEKNMKEKEKEFKDECEKELSNITYLKEIARKEMEELKSERSRIDREKKEIALNNQKLEENQVEMSKDINALDVLSKKINNQREEFINERNQFHSFVEKLKNCESCGEIIRGYEFSDLQIPEGRNVVNEKSKGNLVSWLKKGATVFKLSPHRETNDNIVEKKKETIETENVSQNDKRILTHDKLPESSDDESNIGSKTAEVPEGSQQSEMKSGRKKAARKPKRGARKNQTVQTVVEEDVLTEFDQNDDSVKVNEESGSASRRKRSHPETSLVSGSEMDGGDSEVQSESVVTGGRRKRRQTVAPVAVQTPGGGSRYNLRRHKTGDVATQAQPSTNSEKKKEVSGSIGTQKVTSKHEITNNVVETKVTSEDGSTAMVHVATSKKVDTQILDTAFKAPRGEVIVEKTEVVEEVNATTYEYENEEDNHHNNNDNDDDDGGDDDFDDDDDDDDSGDEEQHHGEVSIGKKIWTFLST
ncbi:unnamed protein product [Lactuca virosa]|uniref:Nuclear matrix constituent protein 1-like protein n=1 Tax=Lactuca virosa TaxID=75947 RepID=A0AAU9LTL4_9ASTR|nr:unnamed protein product [Lactuca virosa]